MIVRPTRPSVSSFRSSPLLRTRPPLFSKPPSPAPFRPVARSRIRESVPPRSKSIRTVSPPPLAVMVCPAAAGNRTDRARPAARTSARVLPALPLRSRRLVAAPASIDKRCSGRASDSVPPIAAMLFPAAAAESRSRSRRSRVSGAIRIGSVRALIAARRPSAAPESRALRRPAPAIAIAALGPALTWRTDAKLMRLVPGVAPRAALACLAARPRGDGRLAASVGPPEPARAGTAARRTRLTGCSSHLARTSKSAYCGASPAWQASASSWQLRNWLCVSHRDRSGAGQGDPGQRGAETSHHPVHQAHVSTPIVVSVPSPVRYACAARRQAEPAGIPSRVWRGGLTSSSNSEPGREIEVAVSGRYSGWRRHDPSPSCCLFVPILTRSSGLVALPGVSRVMSLSPSSSYPVSAGAFEAPSLLPAEAPATDPYVYVLVRRPLALVAGDPDLLFVLLNPSPRVANPPTLQRCDSVALSLGHGLYRVAHLFAYPASDPRRLVAAARGGVDLVGPAGNRRLLAAVRAAQRIVVAWGSFRSPVISHLVAGRVVEVAESMAAAASCDLECLGSAPDGQPLHPLFVRRGVRPRPWRVVSPPPRPPIVQRPADPSRRPSVAPPPVSPAAALSVPESSLASSPGVPRPAAVACASRVTEPPLSVVPRATALAPGDTVPDLARRHLPSRAAERRVVLPLL